MNLSVDIALLPVQTSMFLTLGKYLYGLLPESISELIKRDPRHKSIFLPPSR